MPSKVTKKEGENLPVTGIKKFFTVLENSEMSQSSSTFDSSASTSDTRLGLSTYNTFTPPSSIGNETPGTSTSVQSNLDASNKPSFLNKFYIAHFQNMVKGVCQSLKLIT